MGALLLEIDEDGSGHFTHKEFDIALEIDITEAEQMFSILDCDGDGEVDLAEFVHGMTKLRGAAKSSDIQMLMIQMEKLMSICTELTEGVLPSEGSPRQRRTRRRTEQHPRLSVALSKTSLESS